jgi:hypothetical protein
MVSYCALVIRNISSDSVAISHRVIGWNLEAPALLRCPCLDSQFLSPLELCYVLILLELCHVLEKDREGGLNCVFFKKKVRPMISDVRMRTYLLSKK